MENGKLKVKESGRIIIVVGKLESAPPLEFDFSGISVGNYECEIERTKGTITRIVLNGKDIPKKDVEVQRKTDVEKRRLENEAKQKEEEKLKKEADRIRQNQSFQNRSNAPTDSFDLNLARVPSDTKNTNAGDCDNFALKFYKFARFDFKDKEENEKHFNFFNSKAITKSDKTLIVPVISIKPNFGNINFNAIAKRHADNAKSIFNGENCVELNTFKPDWRLIVGLGTDSVYETGITLHHIYGFPYIPASGIKGITNHFAIDMLKTENQSENDKLGNLKVTNELYDSIFGSTKHQGKITFFDAMPTKIPELKPDIMNVHYPKYYNGTEAPTDTQSPTPILFLTVENTPFQFIIGCKEVDKVLLQIAFHWLKNALEQKGIGAKTAVGYGYMKQN